MDEIENTEHPLTAGDQAPRAVAGTGQQRELLAVQDAGEQQAPLAVPRTAEQRELPVVPHSERHWAPQAVAAAASPASGLPPAARTPWIKQAIAIAAALGFLWWAFRGIDLQKVFASMQSVNVLDIAILVLSTLVSHWLRAVRWVIMLKPLSDSKISVWNSFCAVMFGYAVNIPIPRGGEVVRVVAISRSERMPWVGVLPTLLIDRLLDFALLVAFIGLTMAVLPANMRPNAGYLVPAGIIMCVAVTIGLLLLPQAAAIIRAVLSCAVIARRLPAALQDKLLSLSDQFEQGTRSLKNPFSLVLIALLSFAIWSFYFFNFLIMLAAFGLMPGLQLSRVFIAWTISSVSVIAPTPGCVGTYHIATSKALSMVAAVDPVKALALATLGHAVSFVLVPVITAGICFAIQNSAAARRRAGGDDLKNERQS